MLGALEAIIHWQKNKRKQHLHHLNEKEQATLADTSTRTETPEALVGTMFCEAFSVNHFVHGSEKEDIWSFVNGDEGRFKTLLDLPENSESLKDKIMAVAKVLKLKAGAKEVEQVANALGEIRQLVHAPGFQQEIEDSLHDDSNIPSLTAGDIAEATDEQYQNGERRLARPPRVLWQSRDESFHEGGRDHACTPGYARLLGPRDTVRPAREGLSLLLSTGGRGIAQG